MKFRVTFRHELIINASSEEEAYETFEDIDFGNLDEEVSTSTIESHGYIETISFDKVE